jgi:hypothetical protein
VRTPCIDLPCWLGTFVCLQTVRIHRLKRGKVDSGPVNDLPAPAGEASGAGGAAPALWNPSESAGMNAILDAVCACLPAPCSLSPPLSITVLMVVGVMSGCMGWRWGCFGVWIFVPHVAEALTEWCPLPSPPAPPPIDETLLTLCQVAHEDDEEDEDSGDHEDHDSEGEGEGEGEVEGDGEGDHSDDGEDGDEGEVEPEVEGEGAEGDMDDDEGDDGLGEGEGDEGEGDDEDQFDEDANGPRKAAKFSTPAGRVLCVAGLLATRDC